MKKFIIIMLSLCLLSTQAVLAADDNIRVKKKSNGNTYVYKNGQLSHKYHETPGGKVVVRNSEGQVIRSYKKTNNNHVRVYNNNGEQVKRLKYNNNYNYNNNVNYSYSYGDNSSFSDPRSISDNHSISNNTVVKW